MMGLSPLGSRTGLARDAPVPLDAVGLKLGECQTLCTEGGWGEEVWRIQPLFSLFSEKQTCFSSFCFQAPWWQEKSQTPRANVPL